MFGIAPTGRPIDIWEIGVFRLADGKITEGWFMADEVGVLRQLGVKLPARSDGRRVVPAPPAEGEFAEDVVRRLGPEPPGRQRDNKIVVARSKTKAPPKEDRAHHTLRHWGMQHMRDYAEARGVEKFDPTSRSRTAATTSPGSMAEDDRVWMLFNLRGHNTASFYGQAPTGRFVAMAEVGRMKFTDGRWTDSWYYADGLAMLLHLGATHLIGEIENPRRAERDRIKFSPDRSPMPAAISSVINPRTRDLGGFEVRRILPAFPNKDGRAVHFFRSHGAGANSRRAAASTCGRIRTSGSPP